MFTETGFSLFDEDEMYMMPNSFKLFRNEAMFDQRMNTRGYVWGAKCKKIVYDKNVLILPLFTYIMHY